MAAEGPDEHAAQNSWTFLTHHAHVLLEVAANQDAAIREIAASVGISTRQTKTILNDLDAAGYLDRERRGRRNHYVLHPERPLRHPTNSDHTVADLVNALQRAS